MSILLCLIGIFILCFRFCCAIAASTACHDTSYGRSCSLPGKIETLMLFNEKLMVGSLNSLVSYNLDLQVDKFISLNPQEDAVEYCIGFGPGQLGESPSRCSNNVMLIKRVSKGISDGQPGLMVCGTNAFRPKCTLHDALNILRYEYMTGSVDDIGFSPYSNVSQIVATLTSTGRFFSATNFELYNTKSKIAMAPYATKRNSQFTVQMPGGLIWLNQPTFVSSYEIGDHVYFFFRELAFEVNYATVYSRAARICKNDNGMELDGINTFNTFQKARMVCSVSSAPGSIPYTYDNLKSTFLWKSSDGEQFLYGVFTSPINGPIGSAICKFSFDPTLEGSLTKVFEDGKYLVTDGGRNDGEMYYRGGFVCPGLNGTQRLISNQQQYVLLSNLVTTPQLDNIYTMFGKRFTSIVVDFVEYDGNFETIIYFATAEGDIYYLMIKNGLEKHEGIVYQTGSPLSDLILHRSTDEKRNLYATSGDHILLITLGDCSRYTGCFGCLDSNDAYCGWDNSTNSCKNRLTFSSSLVQATFENNTTRVCAPKTTAESTSASDAGLAAGSTVKVFAIAMSVVAYICFIGKGSLF